MKVIKNVAMLMLIIMYIPVFVIFLASFGAIGVLVKIDEIMDA